MDNICQGAEGAENIEGAEGAEGSAETTWALLSALLVRSTVCDDSLRMLPSLVSKWGCGFAAVSGKPVRYFASSAALGRSGVGAVIVFTKC